MEKKINDDFQQLLASGNAEAELAKLSSIGKKWELTQRLKEAEEAKSRAAHKKDVSKLDEEVWLRFRFFFFISFFFRVNTHTHAHKHSPSAPDVH